MARRFSDGCAGAWSGKNFSTGSSRLSFPSAIAYLQDQLALLGLSDDLKEGVTAFFEKREPRFTGK